MPSTVRWSAFTMALLLAAPACSGDETESSSGFGGASSVASSVAVGPATSGSGAAGGMTSSGAGGGCVAGGDSTTVESSPEGTCPSTPALVGTVLAGGCCKLAQDCKPTCCSCAGSTKQYLAVDCDTGVCTDPGTACEATTADGCQ